MVERPGGVHGSGVPKRGRGKGTRARVWERRPTLLLALGAALGVILAAASLLSTARQRGGGLPNGAVARVNQTLIRTEDYQRLVAALESDLKERADATARRRVLDRLIEEELLIQRGLELGLARHDRRVRANLASAVIASVVSEAEQEEPTDGELRVFFEAERDFFTRPGRLRVRQIFFRIRDRDAEESAIARAREALARLQAGEPFDAVRSTLGDAEIAPLPNALLPAAKLREYVGPTALRSVLELETGERTPPIRSGVGVHVLELLEREAPSVPPYEQIVPQVRAEWVRRAGDRALRTYLDRLRERADIAVEAELP